MNRGARLILSLAVVIGSICAHASGQAVLRDGRVIESARVLGVSLDGVEVETELGERALVDWSRVRSVGGDFAESAGLFEEYAEKSWRARTRLERGDAVAAEPLFEELFTIYAGRRGPTARTVADGLLRCRLRRGARASAVQAWIGWIATGPGTAPAGRSAALLDQQSGLIPSLPPIWTSDAASAVLASDPWQIDETDAAGGTERDRARAETLLALYRASANGAATGEIPSGPELAGFDAQDFGVRLVRAMVLCQSARPEDRAAGRAALGVLRTERSATWIQSWADLGIGLSLVRDADEDDRLRGVVALLRVPALSGRESPYLAGLALALAARSLHEMGDARGASRVLSELEVLFPGHPALAWEELGAIRRASAGAMRPAPAQTFAISRAAWALPAAGSTMTGAS